MWWRKEIDPDLPWYRRPDYTGNLTEAQKRKLDAIRDRDVHPAAKLANLPDEVKNYIGRLELEAYDAKQSQTAAGPILFMLAILCIMALNYFGIEASTDRSRYIVGAAMIIAAWIVYSRKWKANAKEFLPDGGRAEAQADEEFRREWELEYLSLLRREERNDLDSDRSK
ncbi:hypothetical protein [Aliihoeflea sp. 2WW]|uniref:hypothetical protein n=1 Tax=Aliihoeflea sp. 2WW TaxID=1381123 RepID=UPI000465D20C|nr:hypothetical protein [Aliihoeflea sp. 2WW]